LATTTVGTPRRLFLGTESLRIELQRKIERLFQRDLPVAADYVRRLVKKTRDQLLEFENWEQAKSQHLQKVLVKLQKGLEQAVVEFGRLFREQYCELLYKKIMLIQIDLLLDARSLGPTHVQCLNTLRSGVDCLTAETTLTRGGIEYTVNALGSEVWSSVNIGNDDEPGFDIARMSVFYRPSILFQQAREAIEGRGIIGKRDSSPLTFTSKMAGLFGTECLTFAKLTSDACFEELGKLVDERFTSLIDDKELPVFADRDQFEPAFDFLKSRVHREIETCKKAMIEFLNQLEFQFKKSAYPPNEDRRDRIAANFAMYNVGERADPQPFDANEQDWLATALSYVESQRETVAVSVCNQLRLHALTRFETNVGAWLAADIEEAKRLIRPCDERRRKQLNDQLTALREVVKLYVGAGYGERIK
jgi:hypothetical protein